jgi:adenylosuccinate lyase
MAAVWSQENKYRKWLLVETLACEAWAKLGKVPPGALSNIKKKADFDPERIDEIEREVKHDVIAFLTNVAEYVGPDSRFIHIGLTSSDVLDTALAIQMKEAADIIIKDIEDLLLVLEARAYEHKHTVMIGRSHGIHAEPVTFGLKMALWYDEMKRNLRRVEEARDIAAYGKVSGAVGTFANIDPFVEEYVCKKAGLKPAPVSTQVLQRDRHAQYMSALALVASSLDKFSIEIRHLQRTEVYEAEEYFSKGQKGSSAMPHKRNPIASENISGLARVIRGNMVAAYENITLWHERDISHSSVERVILPDSTILVDYMLKRFTGVIKNLLVYPENMLANLNKMKGLVNSQRVLLALVDKGTSREDAYRIVQKNAMQVWEAGKDFKTLLMKDKDVKLTREELEDCFSLEYHTKNVDTIFRRVFGRK